MNELSVELDLASSKGVFHHVKVVHLAFLVRPDSMVRESSYLLLGELR
jgi:hypothetical protein